MIRVTSIGIILLTILLLSGSSVIVFAYCVMNIGSFVNEPILSSHKMKRHPYERGPLYACMGLKASKVSRLASQPAGKPAAG